jgi:hypothetical protein
MGGIVTTTPAATRNHDGRLEVFHIGTDHVLYHAWQPRPNHPLTGWESLRQVNVVGAPCVARNHDLHLEVFALLDNGHMAHAWQPRPGGDPWIRGDLGGAQLGGLGVRLVELGSRVGWGFTE